MLRVSRKAQRCAGIVAKKYGISIAEEPFFMAVTFHDGATQEELTKLVGVDKAMTARVIHALMQKGLVEKIPDPQRSAAKPDLSGGEHKSHQRLGVK